MRLGHGLLASSGLLHRIDSSCRGIRMSALTLVIGNKNYSSWSLRGWLVASQRLGIQ